VDDVYKACDAIRPLGFGFRKEPDGGNASSHPASRFVLIPDYTQSYRLYSTTLVCLYTVICGLAFKERT
jgi:hypothetical protein